MKNSIIFIFFLSTLVNFVCASQDYCSERGGCGCNCAWASPSNCKIDDGSCCFKCCCGSAPSPTPPSPPAQMTLYCPAASDFNAAYNTPKFFDQGWTITAGGGAATKAAFNLLGGYVDFDIEFSGVRTGVNANIYTISPQISSSGFNQNNYCDGAATGSKWCVEVDWIESNGNCGGATTLHTVAGPGSVGCSAWGCQLEYHYNGRPSFHMRVEYKTDGQWTTIRDGKTISPGNLSPVPGKSDWDTLVSAYKSRGAVIYSSQWTGWVPVSDCGTRGDLYSSSFSVKNLKIYGSVVQGPVPRTCSKAIEQMDLNNVTNTSSLP